MTKVPTHENVVIDTNLLLDDPKIMDKLSKKYKKIIFPIEVIEELDKLKYKPATSYSAREAIKAIITFKKTYKDKIMYDTKSDKTVGNDRRIIKCAISNNAVLATKDMSMGIIGESLGLTVELFDQTVNNVLEPYIHMSSEDIMATAGEDVFAYDKEYVGEDYYTFIGMVQGVTKKVPNKNSWFFILINNSDTIIIYANNPLTKCISRIDNNPKYRRMNIKCYDADKDSHLKALDIYQVCAFYAMIEAPNVLICGSYGSGKSLLSTAYALAYNDRKTILSRPNLTVDSRFNIGFLPGSMSEKLMPWMAGVLSSLYQIFSNTKGQMSNKSDGPSNMDFVKDHLFNRYFDMADIASIQGSSFMKGDLVILDEVQLCSISILSIILSRFGKGSKLIMTGDTKQTYGVIPPAENGLLKLLRLLPHKHLAYIELKENYRGELLELADGLQDKLIV